MLRSFKQDPNWKHDAPAMPKWKLERDLDRARRLYDRELKEWLGAPLNPQTRAVLGEAMAEQAARHIVEKLKRIPEVTPEIVLALQDSLAAESTYPLNPRVARRLALQVVCNPLPLAKGIPIPKFISVTQENTWVPMEITSVEDLQEGRRVRKQLNFLVIAGEYAGFEMAKSCPCGYLSTLGYDLGYSFKRRYEDDHDLVGLWICGLLEPSSSLEVQFDKYWLTNQMVIHNRDLVKARRWTEAELLAGEQVKKGLGADA